MVTLPSSGAIPHTVDYVSAFGAPGTGDLGFRLPMVSLLVVFAVATVAGVMAANAFGVTDPWGAWGVAVALCSSLLFIARHLRRAALTRTGILILAALTSLTLAYLIVLLPGTVVRLHPFGFVADIALLIGALAAAVALPAAIVLVGLRVRPALPPLLIGGVAFMLPILVWVALFTSALWLSPPRWRLAAVLSAAVMSPLLSLYVRAVAHLQLMSRWRTDDVPRRLMEGLEAVRDLTGVRFDAVLCLLTTFGGSKVCEVVSQPGRSTLVIADSIAPNLNGRQLLALLAHEAAHVALHHFRRKIIWGVVATVVWLAVAVATLTLMPRLTPSIPVVGTLVTLLPVAFLIRWYDIAVVRRHEAEADAFAVDVAGGSALIEALDVLGYRGPTDAFVHWRWTTHGTWERRIRKIREREQSSTR